MKSDTYDVLALLCQFVFKDEAPDCVEKRKCDIKEKLLLLLRNIDRKLFWHWASVRSHYFVFSHSFRAKLDRIKPSSDKCVSSIPRLRRMLIASVPFAKCTRHIFFARDTLSIAIVVASDKWQPAAAGWPTVDSCNFRLHFVAQRPWVNAWSVNPLGHHGVSCPEGLD